MVPWLFECYKLTNKLSGDVNYSLHCQYAKPKAPEKKKKKRNRKPRMSHCRAPKLVV